jgi:hypothetical protein
MIQPLEMEQLTKVYGPADSIDAGLAERTVSRVWPLLQELTAEQRDRLRAGILDGTLPPALVASADFEGYDKVDGAALSLWTRYIPETSADLAAWAAVIIAMLTYMQGAGTPPSTPPPAQVIVVQIPGPGTPPAAPPAVPPPGPLP